jgi:hypothetical protein
LLVTKLFHNQLEDQFLSILLLKPRLMQKSTIILVTRSLLYLALMFRVAPAMAGETGTENRPPKFDRVVTGQITQGGAPLTGATVSVKGTSTSVNTDANGNFSISVPDDKAVLVIS